MEGLSFTQPFCILNPMKNTQLILLGMVVTLLVMHSAARTQSLTVDYTIGNFTSAVSLSVNMAGEIVVLDAAANACVRLTHDGRELSRVQGSGWGTTEFDSPTDVSAAFPLAIFVADPKNRRIQQFDKELHYVQTIDALQPVEGRTIEGPFRPVSSSQSSQGELFALDADGIRIIKFTTRLLAEREFGTYASGTGRLTTPTDMCMTRDGRIAVADGNRIMVFDQFGNYLSMLRGDSLDVFHAVSSSGDDIIATGSSVITILNAADEARTERIRIPAEMILGEHVEVLRDAARTDAWWYVLTPKNVLVCRRTN
jgi:hypothetical protein